MGGEGVGRVSRAGAGVDTSLVGKRVLIVPNSEQGTWASHIVTPARSVVPVSETADQAQLAMLGINPATAYLMLKQYVRLMPGDWIAQTAANSAVGQYVIALAKMSGVRILNVVRSQDAAGQVRQFGGDRVVIQGENLSKEIEDALGGQALSLVLDPVGGEPVGTLSGSLRTGGVVVAYGNQSGQAPVFPPREFIFRGLQLHGFWLSRWIRSVPQLEVIDLYQKLGAFVADGALSAAVEQVYPLEQFKEAIGHAMRSSRGGKILFRFNE
jgi:NADPH:quinone reductase-like Zn-dependent oxidoreductase